MTELTKIDEGYVWDKSCEEAFQKLKVVLISPEIMEYPLKDSGQFLLDIHASGVGQGAVLCQVKGGCERVIV